MKFSIEIEHLPGTSVLVRDEYAKDTWYEAEVQYIEHRIAKGVNGIHHYYLYRLAVKNTKLLIAVYDSDAKDRIRPR